MSAVTRDPPGAATRPPRPAYAATDPRDQVSPERFTFLVVSLAAVVGLFSFLAQRTSSQFYADDYLYLQLARQGSLTPSWLVVDNYGHFAPLTRLAYFAVQRTVGLDYTAAAVLPAVLTATISLTLAWLFRELLGRRYVVLGLALLGATSVPVLRTMLWWGAAVHVLGAAAMMTLCVAAFVVHCRRGLERYRLLSLAALAVGLLVQERPMITIGYLVLIRYLFGVGMPAMRPIGSFMRRELSLWTPYVVIEVAYVVYRLFFFASAPQPGNASDGAEFLGLSLVRGWAPSLVGSRVLPFEPILTPGVVAGLVATGVLVLVLARRRCGWWRVMAFLVAIYVANIGIVAVGRLSVTDLRALATDLQYYVDVHVGTMLAFVLGFTLLPARSRPGARRQATRLTRVGLPVAALALVVSTAATWHAILDGNSQTVAHSYMYRAQDELHARQGPYALMRTKVPITVAPSFIDPFTDTTAVFSLDNDVADRLDPASDQRLVVLSNGDVVSVHPSTATVVDGPSPRITAGLGSLDNTPGGACLSGDAGSFYKVSLPEPVVGVGYFFAMTYSTGQEQRLLASVRDEQTTYNWSETTLPAGDGVTVVDRLDGTSARTVNLAFQDAVSDFCLTRVWVGRLVATVDGTCRTLDDYAEPLGEAVKPADACDQRWPDAG
jgi:hypothetical protein